MLTMKCSWDKERWYCANDEMFMAEERWYCADDEMFMG